MKWPFWNESGGRKCWSLTHFSEQLWICSWGLHIFTLGFAGETISRLQSFMKNISLALVLLCSLTIACITVVLVGLRTWPWTMFSLSSMWWIEGFFLGRIFGLAEVKDHASALYSFRSINSPLNPKSSSISCSWLILQESCRHCT